jgi:muconolactone delta-isomerase
MGAPEEIESQHDDHIWLNVAGSSWAIKRKSGDLIQLWRGYSPYIEYSIIDISNVNWDQYHQMWTALMEEECGYRAE